MNVFNGKYVDGHPIEVRLTRNFSDIPACHIVFVNEADRNTRSRVLAAAKGKSVLTVGEDQGFTQQGGMINFIMADDRIRFEFNFEASQRAGLIASSRLLSLAKIVKGGV